MYTYAFAIVALNPKRRLIDRRRLHTTRKRAVQPRIESLHSHACCFSLYISNLLCALTKLDLFFLFNPSTRKQFRYIYSCKKKEKKKTKFVSRDLMYTLYYSLETIESFLSVIVYERRCNQKTRRPEEKVSLDIYILYTVCDEIRAQKQAASGAYSWKRKY